MESVVPLPSRHPGAATTAPSGETYGHPLLNYTYRMKPRTHHDRGRRLGAQETGDERAKRQRARR